MHVRGTFPVCDAQVRLTLAPQYSKGDVITAAGQTVCVCVRACEAGEHAMFALVYVFCLSLNLIFHKWVTSGSNTVCSVLENK